MKTAIYQICTPFLALFVGIVCVLSSVQCEAQPLPLRIFLNNNNLATGPTLASPSIYAPQFPAVNQGATLNVGVWVEPSQSPPGSLGNMSLSFTASNSNLILAAHNVRNNSFQQSGGTRWNSSTLVVGGHNYWNTSYYYFGHHFAFSQNGICPLFMIPFPNLDDPDVDHGTARYALYSDVVLTAQTGIGKWGNTVFCLEVGDEPMLEKSGMIIDELILGDSDPQPAIFGTQSKNAGSVFVRAPTVSVQTSTAVPFLLWEVNCPNCPDPPNPAPNIHDVQRTSMPVSEFGQIAINYSPDDGTDESFFDVYLRIDQGTAQAQEIAEQIGNGATTNFPLPPDFPDANLRIPGMRFGKCADFAAMDFDLQDYGTASAYAVVQATSSAVPVEFTTFRGIHLSGDVSSLANLDGDSLCFNPGFTLSAAEAPVWVHVNSVLGNPETPGVDIDIASNANTPGLELSVEIFDWTTGSFELVAVESQAFGDYFKTIEVENNGEFVDPGTGEIRTRLGWRRSGFVIVYPWQICLDMVGFDFAN